MFCPKCGNELPAGEKFCAACGTQIIKEATEESTVTQQGNTEKGSTVKKTILLGVIALVAILAIVLIIKAINKPSDLQETGKTETTAPKNTKSGFDSYEDAIDALMAAAYNKDLEAVINCFPEEMESYAKQLYNEYRAGNISDFEVVFWGFTKLDPDNEYYYNIREAVEYDPSQEYYYFTELSEDVLRTEYGLNVDEIYMIDMESRGKYYTYMFTEEGGYMDDGVRSYLEVAKIGNKWFIVQPGYLWDNFWYEEALQTE